MSQFTPFSRHLITFRKPTFQEKVENSLTKTPSWRMTCPVCDYHQGAVRKGVAACSQQTKTIFTTIKILWRQWRGPLFNECAAVSVISKLVSGTRRTISWKSAVRKLALLSDWESRTQRVFNYCDNEKAANPTRPPTSSTPLLPFKELERANCAWNLAETNHLI